MTSPWLTPTKARLHPVTKAQHNFVGNDTKPQNELAQRMQRMSVMPNTPPDTPRRPFDPFNSNPLFPIPTPSLPFTPPASSSHPNRIHHTTSQNTLSSTAFDLIPASPTKRHVTATPSALVRDEVNERPDDDDGRDKAPTPPPRAWLLTIDDDTDDPVPSKPAAAVVRRSPPPVTREPQPQSTRYVHIANIPPGLTAQDVCKALMFKTGYGDIGRIYLQHLQQPNRAVVIYFHDLRHAQAAIAQLAQDQPFGDIAESQPSLTISFVPRSFLIRASRSGTKCKALSSTEGRVAVRVIGEPLDYAAIEYLLSTFNKKPDGTLVDNMPFSCDVRSLVTIEPSAHFIVEFFDDRAATAAMASLHSKFMTGRMLSLAILKPNDEVTTALATTSLVNPLVGAPTPSPHHVASISLGSRHHHDDDAHGGVARMAATETEAHVFSDYHLQPFLTGYFPSPISSSSMSHAKLLHHFVPAANVLNLDALVLGHETRTTVMIKNLPNRLTDADVFELLNQSGCSRRFDFLYVRVDFGTGANVGYAFVNFLSPYDVLTFARARLGTKWDATTSDKTVVLSWANIQGKQPLVNKFRNSSVMNERDAYRPKLFHSSGPLVGLPQEFPRPNDLDRWTRSQLHARIGLFGPVGSYQLS